MFNLICPKALTDKSSTAKTLVVLLNCYNLSRKEEFASSKCVEIPRHRTSLKIKFALSMGQSCLGIVLKWQ